MPHIHELMDWVVEVYVTYQDKVLLRKHEKYGIWLGVGGHVELDEDPNQAAVREIKEEVGLDVELFSGNFEASGRVGSGFKDLVPPYYMNIHKINDEHQHICLVYFATTESDNVIPENEDDNWVWLGRDELTKMDGVSMDVKMYGVKAIELS